jgi:transcriptional regulator with XRE-family HTH domain
LTNPNVGAVLPRRFQSLPTVVEGAELHVGTVPTRNVVVVAQSADLADLGFRRLGSLQLFERCGTEPPLSYTITVRFITAEPFAAPSFDPPVQEVALATPAMRLLERIRNASGLTFENIAPLAGVSRRSVQSWRAGEQINQRNEERLRALAEAIETIAGAEPLNVRDRLLERVPGSIRIYDLLAEGRYKDAIARGTGARPAPQPIAHATPTPMSTSLDAQLSALESPPATLDRRVNRRFTRRLKR